MSNDQLDPRAELLIRNYMVRAVAIPGVIISLLAFLIGFFVNKLATQEAYNDAYETANQEVFDLIGEVHRYRSSAEEAATLSLEARRKAQNAQLEMQQFLTKARDSADQISTLQTILATNDLVKDVSQNIVNRDDFKRTIRSQIEQVVSDQNQRIAAIEAKLSQPVNFKIDTWSWRQGQDSKRLIPVDEGFCFLTEVRGDFEGRERVRVRMRNDGYWQLSGIADRDRGVSARAACVSLIGWGRQ
ncbi:MAG: hypothetical protein OXF33_09045 [Rhodospirillales bacterium]|nr:hypothetical protein [Rhodospirillales bacterium]